MHVSPTVHIILALVQARHNSQTSVFQPFSFSLVAAVAEKLNSNVENCSCFVELILVSHADKVICPHVEAPHTVEGGTVKPHVGHFLHQAVCHLLPQRSWNLFRVTFS